jgi:hypothetical protein
MHKFPLHPSGCSLRNEAMGKKPVLALALGICLLSGCKSATIGAAADSNGIVGTWQGTQPNPMKNAKIPAGTNLGTLPDIAVTMEFSPDGLFSLKTGSGQINVELDGTYTYNDSAKQLTLKPEKMKIGTSETKMPDSQAKSPPQVVTWKSPNEIEMRYGMSDLDLKRK